MLARPVNGRTAAVVPPATPPVDWQMATEIERRMAATLRELTEHSEQLGKRSEGLAAQHETERRQWARERDDLPASLESLSASVATLLTTCERQAEDYAQLEAALNAVIQASSGQ